MFDHYSSFLCEPNVLYIIFLLYLHFHVHSRTKAEFSIGGESFHCVGQRVLVKGFTSIMPWLAVNEKNLPQFTKGEKIEVARVDLHEVYVLSLHFSFTLSSFFYFFKIEFL